MAEEEVTAGSAAGLRDSPARPAIRVLDQEQDPPSPGAAEAEVICPGGAVDRVVATPPFGFFKPEQKNAIQPWKVDLAKSFFTQDASPRLLKKGSEKVLYEEVIKDLGVDEINSMKTDLIVSTGLQSDVDRSTGKKSLTEEIVELRKVIEEAEIKSTTSGTATAPNETEPAKSKICPEDTPAAEPPALENEQGPAVLNCRPSPRKSQPVPQFIPAPPLQPDDQGRSCVSIHIRSSHEHDYNRSISMIRQKLLKLEEVSMKFSPKFSRKSSGPALYARVDFCFNLPSQARGFFKAVGDIIAKAGLPRLMTPSMISEEDLGYWAPPVLDETDLLVIQSPDRTRNVFKTQKSIASNIKVVQTENSLAYQFKSVADVNSFLHSHSTNFRHLGQLRKHRASMNQVKTLIPDHEKNYYLVCRNGTGKISSCGESSGFSVVSMPGENTTKLAFKDKFYLFKYLVSKEAASIDELQFDPDQIKISSADNLIHLSSQSAPIKPLSVATDASESISEALMEQRIARPSLESDSELSECVAGDDECVAGDDKSALLAAKGEILQLRTKLAEKERALQEIQMLASPLK